MDSAIYLWNCNVPLDKIQNTFPSISFKKWSQSSNKNIKENVLSTIQDINKDYNNIIFVSDKDNVKMFENYFNSLNGKKFKFESIRVVSSGLEDPDNSSKGELPIMVNNTKRDRYYKGEIFNVGDKVVSGDKVYEIAKRGTNHLMLLEKGGDRLVAKFINDVEEYRGSSNTLTKKEALNLYESVLRVVGEDHTFKDVYSTADLVNNAMEYISTCRFGKELLYSVNECLDLADKYGVPYDENLVPQKIFELRCSNKMPRRPRKGKGGLGKTLYQGSNDGVRKRKVQQYNDTIHEDFDLINEKISRQERIKKGIRFKRTKTKRERQRKIAMNRRADHKTVEKRAKRSAIKAVKEKYLKGRDIDKLSVAEKERLEDIIKNKAEIVKRVARKMVPIVRKKERERLSSKTKKKGK